MVLISLQALADTPLPTSGTISLTKVSPAWTDYESFNTIEEAQGEKTKVFTFRSSIAQTISSDPTLSNTNGFSLKTSSSECKSGFVFTTSNTCTIQVKFSADGLGITNETLFSTLNWNGFTFNLKAPIVLTTPYLVATDTNNRSIHQVNFNNMFANHNNAQSRTLVFRDIKKATTYAPTFTIDNSNFVLSYSCDYKSLNSTTGCVLTVNFNSQNKTIGTYTGVIRLVIEGLPLNEVTVTANVVDINQKGSTPNYFFSTSNGEIINSANFNSLSNKSTTSPNFYLYLRDGNKATTDYVSYSLSNSDFTSYYSNCSPSSLHSANGCSVRLVFGI